MGDANGRYSSARDYEAAGEDDRGGRNYPDQDGYGARSQVGKRARRALPQLTPQPDRRARPRLRGLSSGEPLEVRHRVRRIAYRVTGPARALSKSADDARVVWKEEERNPAMFKAPREGAAERPARLRI
jgi:hypothetical protein